MAVQEGDRNSKFFHNLVKERRRKLFIFQVKDAAGEWIEDRHSIAQGAVTFFENLFSADEDNDMLTSVPEETEIKEAVLQMNSVSAAGPDGFSGAFYKACWDIISHDVVRMVQSYFLGREFSRAITHTSIVLLPKKPNPETFADYRPISLCNFSSKIVTKVMVVRLASVLPKLLSPPSERLCCWSFDH